MMTRKNTKSLFSRPPRNDAAIELAKKFITEYWEKNHHSPSIREIALALNTSNSVVGYWLERLEHDAWIEPMKPSLSRNIIPASIFKSRPVFPVSEKIEVRDLGKTFLEVIKELPGGSLAEVYPSGEDQDYDR